MRTFEDRLAVRERVPLLVGLMGPSGGGKTYSALRLATGIQKVSGGDIFLVDTEARRGLHNADRFKYRYVPFGAPFGPLDYLAAIDHCVKKGAGTIIIDSMSHEHEGPGGVLEMHAAEHKRLGEKESTKMLAWAKPKAERRRLINTILQIQCNFIFCFRAKEKIKLATRAEKANGHDAVTQLGWMPIAGEEFVYEMTVNCLLLPGAEGRPTWRSDEPGEKMMIKLPEQFRKLLLDPEAGPLSEHTGNEIARWAAGDDAVKPPTEDECAALVAALEMAPTLPALDELATSNRGKRWSREQGARIRQAIATRKEDLQFVQEEPGANG